MKKKITIRLAAALLLIVLLSFLFYNFWFLRMPDREIPSTNNIVSPANGIIKEIIEIKDGEPVNIEKGLFGNARLITEDTIRDGYIIVVEMDIFNVHYQRSPAFGRVIGIKYTKGAFLNALKPGLKATFENERNEIKIHSPVGQIKVVQIAGYLARRIETLVEEQDSVEKGQPIGLIRLGSQVALVMPKMDLEVKKGDDVIEGQTIIANY